MATSLMASKQILFSFHSNIYLCLYLYIFFFLFLLFNLNFNFFRFHPQPAHFVCFQQPCFKLVHSACPLATTAAASLAARRAPLWPSAPPLPRYASNCACVCVCACVRASRASRASPATALKLLQFKFCCRLLFSTVAAARSLAVVVLAAFYFSTFLCVALRFCCTCRQRWLHALLPLLFANFRCISASNFQTPVVRVRVCAL